MSARPFELPPTIESIAMVLRSAYLGWSDGDERGRAALGDRREQIQRFAFAVDVYIANEETAGRSPSIDQAIVDAAGGRPILEHLLRMSPREARGLAALVVADAVLANVRAAQLSPGGWKLLAKRGRWPDAVTT